MINIKKYLHQYAIKQIYSSVINYKIKWKYKRLSLYCVTKILPKEY